MVDEVLRLRPDAVADTDDQGRLMLSRGRTELAVGPFDADTAAAAAALRGDGLTAEVANASDGGVGELVRELDDGGWLGHTLRSDRSPLLTVRPQADRNPLSQAATSPDGPLILSRFAVIRRDGHQLVVESPRSLALVVLDDPRLASLAAALATPHRAADLAESAEWLPAPAQAAVMAILARAGLLVAADGDEENVQVLAQWSPVELLYHARSRQGRHANGYGPTWPMRGRFPLPELRRPWSGEAVELPSPRTETRPALSLDEVIARRMSVREHDDASPMTVAQLSEFLWRAARVRHDVTTWDDGTPRPVGMARPYPSGGAMYVLELYPAVGRCAGLAPGLYRYDPFDHRLALVAPPGPGVDRILDDGRRKSEMASPPQVVVVVTARFGRTMWKYESIAYALTLKDVGALYQTMYLVATAMGLAPCAIGGGDSDAFCRTAGLDYYEESSVGEFLLGSRTS